MTKLKHFFFLSLVILTPSALAQELKSNMSDRTYTIPFQLTAYNNISIKAILNEKDTVQLMFHTAANGITLTEASIQKIKSLKFEGNIDGIKSWGGQENSSRISNNNSLQIGKIKWTNLEIAENKNSGQDTDGKFGIDFFKDRVIAIDFDRNIITLDKKLPSKVKSYEKLKLVIEHDNLFLTANCLINGVPYENKFLIHSGYAGAILFDDQFTAANKLGEQLKIVSEKSLKDSFGNVLKTKNAILPVLKIGNLKLTDVPVGFFEGAIGRQKMSMMGGEVLKRFNLIIDQQNGYVYLKRNNLTATDYRPI